MRGAWMVVAVAGCGFEVPSSGGSAIDSPLAIDAAVIDAAGSMACPWPYAPMGFDPCMGVPPGMLPGLMLDDNGIYLYDTGDGTLDPPSGPDLVVPSTVVGGVRVMWTKRFQLGAGATLRVKGDDPFVLVSQSAVIIDGTIDVGSYVTGNDKIGAGSNPNVCTATQGAPGATCIPHGGSGGGGGGFGTAGAAGGVGGLTRNCPGLLAGAGIAGGVGGPATTDANFRGGCDGGDGADGDAPQGGDGGDGGGAIHIIARDQLRVGTTGRVLAGGGGGTGANNGRSGGGGGGSGGLIMLAGTTIRIDASAVLAANGGAGGGGVNNGAASNGDNGQPSRAAALGGAPEGTGGNGGNGATGTVDALVGGAVDRGGGGGGGGAGKIRLTSTMPMIDGAAVITPAAN